MHKLKFHIFSILWAATAFGQQPEVSASVDSVRILIGSQAHLILRAQARPDAIVVFPAAKNIGRFEVLETYPVDTIEQGNSYELVKKYGITQFDPGRHTIPSLSIAIDGRNYTTKALTLEVKDIVVDTTKQKMFDIKPVATQESEIDFWWYLLALLCFALTGWAIWWDVKRRKANKKPEIQLLPIDKAIGGLKRLDHKYKSIGDVKEYYSELTGILKLYIEETFDIPAMESTTAGLMQSLPAAAAANRIALPQQTYLQIEGVLKNADLVKFARSRPPSQQVVDDRAASEHIIHTIESAIPEPTQEEIAQTEAYKLAQVQKKGQRKRKLIIAGCVVLVVGTLAVLGSLRLYSYLQENYIGYSAKELWDGEWVKSEYGNPAVTINTPKVLHRLNTTGLLPKEELDRLQEIQVFDYGVPFGEFSVTVRTMNYLPGIQPDVDHIVNVTFDSWEQQGAKNITTNGERFITEDGFEGIRAFGNFTSSSSDTRFYYEFISFQQLQGLQQVLIMHKDQDEYGIKLAEKIKKSIRYRKVR